MEWYGWWEFQALEHTGLCISCIWAPSVSLVTQTGTILGELWCVTENVMTCHLSHIWHEFVISVLALQPEINSVRWTVCSNVPETGEQQQCIESSLSPH